MERLKLTVDHHELSNGMLSSPARRKISSLNSSLLSDAPIVAYWWRFQEDEALNKATFLEGSSWTVTSVVVYKDACDIFD